MKEIKVGIVGAGGIAGGKHLPGHRSVKGVEVIAVCDIVEEREFTNDEASYGEEFCQAVQYTECFYGL